MKKKRLIIIVLVIFIAVVIIATPLFRMYSLNGKWCVYTGTDIKTEENLAVMIDTDNFICFYKNIEYEYNKDVDRDGVATYHASLTNRLYIGDGIYKYRILHKNGEKILILTVLSEKNIKTQYYIYSNPITKENFRN